MVENGSTKTTERTAYLLRDRLMISVKRSLVSHRDLDPDSLSAMARVAATNAVINALAGATRQDSRAVVDHLASKVQARPNTDELQVAIEEGLTAVGSRFGDLVLKEARRFLKRGNR